MGWGAQWTDKQMEQLDMKLKLGWSGYKVSQFFGWPYSSTKKMILRLSAPPAVVSHGRPRRLSEATVEEFRKTLAANPKQSLRHLASGAGLSATTLRRSLSGLKARRQPIGACPSDPRGGSLVRRPCTCWRRHA